MQFSLVERELLLVHVGVVVGDVQLASRGNDLPSLLVEVRRIPELIGGDADALRVVASEPNHLNPCSRNRSRRQGRCGEVVEPVGRARASGGGGPVVVPAKGYWLSNTSMYFVIPRNNSTSDNLTVGMMSGNNARFFINYSYKVN